MVRFIKQEAEEKANEIRVSAEEVGAECCLVDTAVQGCTHTMLVMHSWRSHACGDPPLT
jgi:hypothetical protein